MIPNLISIHLPTLPMALSTIQQLHTCAMTSNSYTYGGSVSTSRSYLIIPNAMTHSTTRMPSRCSQPPMDHTLIDISNSKSVHPASSSLPTSTTPISHAPTQAPPTTPAPVPPTPAKSPTRDGMPISKQVLLYIYLDLSIIGRGRSYDLYKGNLFRIDKSTNKPTRYLAYNPAMNSPACFHQPLKFVDFHLV